MWGGYGLYNYFYVRRLRPIKLFLCGEAKALPT
jgi:hypothetical protein